MPVFTPPSIIRQPPRPLLQLLRLLSPFSSTPNVRKKHFFSTATTSSSSCSTSTYPLFSPSFPKTTSPSFSSSSVPDVDLDATMAIIAEFKRWFKKPTEKFDQIYDVLYNSHDAASLNAALSSLNLSLSEQFVIQVLRHQPRISTVNQNVEIRDDTSIENNFLLLRLKFFDWAGRQNGYHHTRATYHVIFKLLSRARLVSVIFDWLRSFSEARSQCNIPFTSPYAVRFHEILVVGYAVAGRSSTALQVLARMRFQGIDLSGFSYHVLLNALVEESTFDLADSVLTMIREQGHFSPMTSFINIKSLCKQGKVEEAKKVLFKEMKDGTNQEFTALDRGAGIVVNALCRMKRFDEASRLVEEFGGSRSYAVWLRNLIETCRIDGAIDFIRSKKESEDYVPEVFSYNRLISQLLFENRLEEVYDVLVEMREDGITPNRGTMNAALSFFCKAGMVDIAVKLYRSREEFGLTPSCVAFNHLINALCGNGSVDEACSILEESMRQGYFPGKQTFRFLAEVLCNEGKLDKMGKLLDAALKRNTVPITTACARYISALCKAGQTEEGYLVISKTNSGMAIPLGRHAYVSLINGFISLRRSDMICRLLLEMQDSGHKPSRKLYREVICCLCQMGCLNEVFALLEMQLLRNNFNRMVAYNWFIDGLGHAKRSDLATRVFGKMFQEGVEPNKDTRILLLQSYMKGQRISHVLNLFKELHNDKEPSKRMYNMLVVGLCKVGRQDQALPVWEEMRAKSLIPSLYSYEELLISLCSCGDYNKAIEVLVDLLNTGRQVSPFICNILLLHTLKTPKFCHAWDQVGAAKGSLLAKLVAVFSSGITMKQSLEDVYDFVEKCFPVNVNTYNMLLRGAFAAGRIDYAFDLFKRISSKGYAPNKWTYDIMIYGCCKHGRKSDAEIWMEKMYQSGFYPSWHTMSLFNKTLDKVAA